MENENSHAIITPRCGPAASGFRDAQALSVNRRDISTRHRLCIDAEFTAQLSEVLASNNPLSHLAVVAAKSPRSYRHLSPSIAPKRHLFTVEVTVRLVRPDRKSFTFKYLQVPETIEWE